jgi:uncharacterized protein YbjT (DUF2867 family)
MTEPGVNRDVFVTGATGYIGRPLIARLLHCGHRVRALARAESAARVPAGAELVTGNALQADSFAAAIAPGSTLIHLIGTPHPSPAKAAEFQRVDLASAKAAVRAAREAGVAHFIYLSVAQPAPVMQAYVDVRRAGEAAIIAAGLRATMLRPWYVLGPGHRWPWLLAPMYALAECFNTTRDSAQRLGLITLPQMLRSLEWAVENPPMAGASRILDVPAMRALWQTARTR